MILCQGVLNFINDQLESYFLLLLWGLMGLQHRLLWEFKDLFLLNVLLIQLDQNAILYWLVVNFYTNIDNGMEIEILTLK